MRAGRIVVSCVASRSAWRRLARFSGMRQRLVLAAGFVALAIAALWVLAQDAPRRAGTNNVQPSGEVARLAPGREVCQPEDVPPSTRSVAVWGHARGTSGSEVRGRSGSARADGTIRIELSSAPSPGSAELCLTNRGPTRLTLLGAVTAVPEEVSRSLRSSRPVGVLGVNYYREGSESWLQLAPTVADRFSLGKAGFLGGWTLWLVLATVLAGWVCAVAAVGGRERTP
jgi:hypothetical protein